MKDVWEEVMEVIPLISIWRKHTFVGHTKRKRSTSNKSAQNSEDPGDDLAEMEVDNNNQVPEWVVVQMVESQQIEEELAHEGPTIF
jgi:hypothetical protein